MTDPMATAVATVVVAKAMDGLTEAGRAAVEALVKLVRRRLGSQRASQEILVRAESEPAAEANRIALAELIANVIDEDRAFAEELRRRWLGVPDAWRGMAQKFEHNSIQGEIHGNVVQARDIHGGISFG